MKTTLNAIRSHNPCEDGWKNLLKHLGKTQADDEPLSIVTVLDSNGLDDALWCLQAVTGHEREIRLYAVWCARQVQHLMSDPRSLAALDVAERYANGNATDEELSAARAAAWAAWAEWAARAEWAAQAAEWAATGASEAAWAAGAAGAAEAVWATGASEAPWATGAAQAAEWAATGAVCARDAARAAARDAQSAELRRLCAAIAEGKS